MDLLTQEEIQSSLADLPGWQVESGVLWRTFSLPSFANAALLLGAIGQLAEAAGHHPDLRLFNYNQLTVQITTHSAGGLTGKDFALARQIQQLPLRKPKA